jgi:hypothetical protein
MKKPKGKKRHRHSTLVEIRRQVSNRQDELYIDYLDQLSEKERNWLEKFNKEEVLASFPKKENKKELAKCFNNTKAKRKKIYDRNNARNKDILINAKVNNPNIGSLISPGSDSHWSALRDIDNTNYNHHENHLISLIDELYNPKKDD